MRKPDKCPDCGKTIDAHSAGNDAKPSPGDISVCLYCSSLNVFDDHLMLSKPTSEQIEQYKSDPILWYQIESYIAAVTQVNRPQ